MSCSVSSTATSDRRTAVASRPKLSLQTSSLPRTFGRSSTGLSLSFAANPTASPTVRNTFKNAYEPAHPSSATASPSKTFSNNKFITTNHHHHSSPYQLPLGVISILRNSPLEPTSRRRSISVSTNAGNGGSAPRRVFFPAKKQVSYRQPLEEEIRTVHYIARHSDLVEEDTSSSTEKPEEERRSDSESDSNSSPATSDTSGGSDDDTGSETSTGSLSKLERKKRKHLGAERQVRAVALLDGLEGDAYGSSTPQTPRQDRVKRRCEWKWTLGPLEKREETTPLSQTPLGITPTVLSIPAAPEKVVKLPETDPDSTTESKTNNNMIHEPEHVDSHD